MERTVDQLTFVSVCARTGGVGDGMGVPGEGSGSGVGAGGDAVVREAVRGGEAGVDPAAAGAWFVRGLHDSMDVGLGLELKASAFLA